jgi:hypothetical protein
MKSINKLTYYKFFAAITLGIGLGLHISRALFGAEYFLKNILTLNNDKLFSIPMVLAALFAWLGYSSTDLTKRWRKIVYTLIAVYVTISVPVHVKSWFTNDLKQLEAFPEKYSYFIIPVLLFMLLFTLSLKKK